MRKRFIALASAAALSIVPMGVAHAQENPGDPNDVDAVDNPVDSNDEGGFDDWGLLGLAGLIGLAGLAGRNRTATVYDRDRTATRV